MKYHAFIYILLLLASLAGLLIAFVSGIEVGFSISKEEYESELLPVLSVLGTWVGAFATCSAVIVSLWLAWKQLSQDREILDCNLNMNLIPGFQDEPCIGLTVVSKGNRPANIQSVSWFGENAKVAMWVARFNRHSDTLPKVLSYGEKLNILHEQGFEKHLAKYIHQHMDGKFEGLYLQLSTTTTTQKIPANEALLKIIKDSESANKSNNFAPSAPDAL